MAYYPKERNVSGIFYYGNAGSDQVLETNSSFTYNASTDTVTATTFAGNASTATLATQATTAQDASGLTAAVTISLTDQITGTATFQDAGDTATIATFATADLINDQTAAAGAGATDFLLITSGTNLRKVTKANFVSDLGGGTMSDFVISGDGGPGQTIEQGNTALFVGGQGLQTTASATDTITIAMTGHNGSLIADGTVANAKLTNSSFSLDGDLGTTEIVSLGDTMSILGGSGISTTASVGENVTINLTDTAVTAGSYGSSSAVGTFTVDANGRLTAAADVTIDGSAINNNTITIAGDNGTTDTVALTETLTIAGGSGIETSRTVDNQITINAVTTVTSGTVTDNQTLSSDVHIIDVTAASRSVGLPATPPPGQVYRVKKIDSSANTITITGSDSKTIDGGSSYILYNQFEAVTFICDSNGWYVF